MTCNLFAACAWEDRRRNTPLAAPPPELRVEERLSCRPCTWASR
eukprot:CAMPEP_0175284612 /NCGR_PEP_ID=MMETSP0093-20121207/52795_1 /TAXON_ID=311494 /ORGANISM="Alexandrium monilatum, Strain CCMP3105" /LENGTH=43 /DNA_ID= /DNA_START= /DNA_END= /DNA_ORIENTATION=